MPEIPHPGDHDRLGVVSDHGDELALEKLVAVEEDIIAEPGAGGGEETATEMLEGHLEGLDVVARNAALGLGGGKLPAGVGHLVDTVVDQPEGADGRDGEREAEGPLDRREAVRRVPVAVVEDEKQDDQQSLVAKLAPALHEEGGGDLAAAMQTIFLGRDLSGGDGILHRRSGRDGVFTAYAET